MNQETEETGRTKSLHRSFRVTLNVRLQARVLDFDRALCKRTLLSRWRFVICSAVSRYRQCIGFTGLEAREGYRGIVMLTEDVGKFAYAVRIKTKSGTEIAGHLMQAI